LPCLTALRGVIGSVFPRGVVPDVPAVFPEQPLRVGSVRKPDSALFQFADAQINTFVPDRFRHFQYPPFSSVAAYIL
jgi:hypothetical protein